MQNAIWKLSALAGVVGIGFLVILQVQRSLPQQGEQAPIENELVSPELGAPTFSDPFAQAGFPENDSFDNFVQDQGEPAFQVQDEPTLSIDAAQQSGELSAGHVIGTSSSNIQNSTSDESSLNSEETDFGLSSTDEADPFEAGDSTDPDSLVTENAVSGTGLDFREQPADTVLGRPLAASAFEELSSQSVDPFEAANPKTNVPFSRALDNEQPLIPQDTESPITTVSGTSDEPRLLVDDSPIGEADAESNSASTFSKSAMETVPESDPFSAAAENSEDSPGPQLPQPPASQDVDPVGKRRILPSANQTQDNGPLDPTAPAKLLDNSRDPFESTSPFEATATETDTISPEETVDPEAGVTSSLDHPTTQNSANVNADPFAPTVVSEESNADGPSDAPSSKSAAAATISQEEPQLIRVPPREVLGTSADAASRQLTADAPRPLNPTDDEAIPLPTQEQKLFQGDGTISQDAPRGPQKPQLTIEKIAPRHAVLGRPMVYKIRIKNVGISRAAQVVVEDRIPKGSKLTGTIPRAELVGKRLVWRMGTVAPGEEKTIAVRVIPTSAGQIGSIATVNFVSEVAAATLITAPDLKLEITGPSQVDVGEPAVFQFQITNSGNGDATGVFLRDVIPAGLRHPDGHDLEYPIGTLPAGKSRAVTLTLTAAQLGNFVNRAVVTADGDLSSAAESAVEITGSQLLLTRSGPEKVSVGQAVFYSNSVSNQSDRPAAGITVVEVLPEGLEFLQATAGGQFNSVQRTVAWQLKTLGPQQSQELKVQVRPRTPGAQAGTVKLVDENGREIRNDTSTSVVGFASLSVKSSVSKNLLRIGEQVSYELSIQNRGNGPATNVVAKVILPAEVQFDSAKGPIKYKLQGNVINLAPRENLEAGKQIDFQIVVSAQEPGDARLAVQVQCDQMRRPVNQEEAVVIYAENGDTGAN